MSSTPAANSTLAWEFLSCPVTALAFLKAEDRLYVLSGEDINLVVYDVETSEICGRLRVFAAQPIHGIYLDEEGDSDVLIWGAQSVAVLSRTNLEDFVRGEPGESPVEVTAPDWIYDGVLSPFDRSLAALVTAHNEIVPLHISSDRRTLKFGELQSPSRPILCSASVQWLSDKRLLVVGGTIFGEIIVWNCHLTRGSEDACEVLFVLSGHEGSVFGVSISPEIQLSSGSKGRLLASCSDDRTIRVWDISQHPTGHVRTDSHSQAKLHEARETGFGPADVASSATEEPMVPLAIATGHISRIWQVRFSQQSQGRGGFPFRIYSFGEDATVQQWELELDVSLWEASLFLPLSDRRSLITSTALRYVQTVHGHRGKHIWASALLSQQPTSRQPLIVTGGSDGMIQLTGNPPEPASSMAKETSEPVWVSDYPEPKTVSIAMSDVLGSLAGSDHDRHPLRPEKFLPNKNDEDVFHRYVFLPDNSIFATTPSGRIFIGTVGVQVTWAEVEVPDDIRKDLLSYQVVRSSGMGHVFLGSSCGRLYVYDSGKIILAAEMTDKIADILFLPDENSDTPGGSTGRVLMTMFNGKRAKLLTLNPLAQGLVHDIKEIDLGERVVITAARFCNRHLVLGSRFGSIMVYSETESGDVRRTCRTEGSTRDAISSIISVPGKAGTLSPYFLATSRDGKYRIYEITEPGSEACLRLRHESSPPLGPMIEGACFVKSADGETQLILSGFRSQSFVVWNETMQQQLAEVECGGAHRAFTYVVNPNRPEEISFVWRKATQTYIYHQSQASSRAVKSGGHGREIRTLSSCGEFIATGAEDTDILVWRYGEQKLRCLSVLHKHTKGLQSVKWFGENYLLSCGGNEEFYVWKISRLESDYQGLAVVCEATYPDRSNDEDQRIMSFDVSEMKSQSSRAAERIMYITLIISDSTVRTYQYTSANGFKLLALGRYTGALLTQVRHLCVGDESLDVLTASTDGHVVVWRAPCQVTSNAEGPTNYKVIQATKLHQSAVKTLDLEHAQQQGETRWLVITGGDDSALGVLDLTRDQSSNGYRLGGRAIARSVHAAAITGLRIIKSQDGTTTVLTCSNDQRVKVWQIISEKTGTKRVALLQNHYSAVADPGDLDIMAPEGKVVVAGVGIEVWDINYLVSEAILLAHR